MGFFSRWGESGQKKTINSPKVWIFVSPKPAALAIELLVIATALGALAAVVLRRQHYKKLHAEATTYTAQKNQSLQDIAKKHEASWKTIAKLNKLEAPYHIEVGQVLKIPTKATSGTKHDTKAKSD